MYKVIGSLYILLVGGLFIPYAGYWNLVNNPGLLDMIVCPIMILMAPLAIWMSYHNWVREEE